MQRRNEDTSNRFQIPVFSVVLLLAAMCSVAEAAKVHLKNSVTPLVSFGVDDDGNDIVVLDAALAGLGNGDVLITAEFLGEVVVVVVNPQGHPSPGQQVPVQAIGQVSIPASEIKNGNLFFTVAAVLPFPLVADPGHTTPVEDALGLDLPNDQWHAFVESVDFPTSITLTVQQAGNTTVIVLDAEDFVVVP